MKKLLYVLMALCFSSCLSSLHKQTFRVAESSQTGDVCLLSFEEANWIAYGAQVQNNTDFEIQHVAFRIIYYDKSGNQVDYDDVETHCSIDAHMTRMLTVNKLSTSQTDFDCAVVEITQFD